MVIKVTAKGIKPLKRKLNAIDLAVDSNVIVKASADLLLRRIKERFLREVDDNNEPWAPLKDPRARAGKSTRNPGGARAGGILRDTDALFKSLRVGLFGNGVAKISSDIPYAVYHQKGIGVPERRFLGCNAEDSIAIKHLILTRIEKAKKSG